MSKMSIEMTFKIIKSNTLPPISIVMDPDTELPTLIVNERWRVWLLKNRNIIPGIGDPLVEVLRNILEAFLDECWAGEQFDLQQFGFLAELGNDEDFPAGDDLFGA